jgi:glycerophosphoryl diester phosphodiesterase
MASNLRFILARNKAGEVIVKFQYNESDVMPWKPWAEFKEYCTERINWDPKQHNLLEKNSEYNPMFIAHRGLQSMGPENSFSSFKAAAQKGMWAIETDFRITADGQVVCLHDKTLDRTTDGKGLVADMTLAQIKTLKLKPVNTKTVKQLYDYAQVPDEEKAVPTMDEYFQICKAAGSVAFIELKEDKGVINAMIEAIKKHGLKGSCVISSGNLALLEKYRAAGGKETIHLIFAKPEQIAKVRELGNASVSFKYSDLDAQVDLTIEGVHVTSFRQLVDLMHDFGIRICFRAADSPAEARRHIDLGVDYMPTNVTATL